MKRGKRESKRSRGNKTLLKFLGGMLLIVVVLLNLLTHVFSIVRYFGNGMEPALHNGQILIIDKIGSVPEGDVIAFYYNNKVLVKRVIAVSGDWVDIDDDGTVYVNGNPISEPYVTEKAFGNCDIELPYQVPDEKYFMMGDHRSVSVDSRSTLIGAISQEQIVGKIVFSCWPLNEFGIIK